MWKRIRIDAAGRFEQHGLTGATTLSVTFAEGCIPIRGMVVSSDSDQEFKIHRKPAAVIRAAVIRARAVDANSGQPIPQFNFKLDSCDRADWLSGDSGSGVSKSP